MRTLMICVGLGLAALLAIPQPAGAESFFNGYRRLDPMGADRPPAPEPNARRGSRRVYEPLRGDYPACAGFKRVGDRCRLPTGQVCMVYDFGLGACV